MDCLSDIFQTVIGEYENSTEDLFFLLEFFSSGHAEQVRESFFAWFPVQETMQGKERERKQEQIAQRYRYYS